MLLFLDCDGVLHPVYPRADLPPGENDRFVYLARFTAVMREFPGVDIVVASDWRKLHSLGQLRALLGPELGARVIGATPDLPRPDLDWDGHRQREVMHFLGANRPSGGKWIAVDDDPRNYLRDAPLVLCADGFRDAEEAALRRALTELVASSEGPTPRRRD
jgi:hypothetical protein